jgi:Pyruvate/2-oxoacid:ferredoxin oxidoreductase delta subunit/flavodoxin
MENQNPSVGLMFFSPTGTTRKVCEEVAAAISTNSSIKIDLTRPQNSEPKTLDGVDIWVVGVPVYASRVPAVAYRRMSLVLDNVPKKTPAVAVAVYGNVDAGIALKQLVDLLSGKGLAVIGAGEFIGQHWFKTFHGMDPKGAVDRPDAEDLAVARELGAAVLEKGLDSEDISAVDAIQSARLALKFKFTGEKRVLGLLGASTVDPSKCTKCQACVKACPMDCIDPQTLMSDPSEKKCLGCGNCLRVCPNKARSQNIKMKWLVRRMAKPQNVQSRPVYYA